MNRRIVVLGLLAAGLCAAQEPLKWNDWLNRGISAFRSAKYAEAVDAFQHAADLNPGDHSVRMYLATAYLTQWVPGADSISPAVRARSSKRLCV